MELITLVKLTHWVKTDKTITWLDTTTTKKELNSPNPTRSRRTYICIKIYEICNEIIEKRKMDGT